MDDEFVHEVWENQHWSVKEGKWEHPGRDSEPAPWTNRVHQPLIIKPGVDMSEWPCLPGWEWQGDWRVDIWHAPCDVEGWRYAPTFQDLSQHLLARSLPNGIGSMSEASKRADKFPTRWRRWLRGRRRAHDPRATRLLRGPSVPQAWREGMPSSAILLEGWLSRFQDGLGWVASWCVLARAEMEGVEQTALMYCDSLESMCVASVLLPPDACLHTTVQPHVETPLAMTISAEHLACCFGIGSEHPSEGVLHAALTVDEMTLWRTTLDDAMTSVQAKRGAAPPMQVGAQTVGACVLVP
jgi:hypothetical protein